MASQRNFSSFSLAEAYQLLEIETLQSWQFEAEPLDPSDFFQLRLQRLQKNFDLRSYEKSKELVIDAYCDEAIDPLGSLKIWKGAAIRSDRARGNADYLIAKRRDYLESPYLCIVEAKKDDFEQGLAQCLAEMYACHWQNTEAGLDIDCFGVITNATTWQFYRLSHDETGYTVAESRAYTNGDPAQLLGALHHLFSLAEREAAKRTPKK